ncbi:uncharacterized protein LOC123873700 [Maniola jurtina]|uniref:uncharacterized protein LOC123873700 n=1 Tax=Maniola jurtina TaxID=191418 RepID=UPI001E68F53B|nr:uncharacterized protein LOC123873700 [Maniola jurtina]
MNRSKRHLQRRMSVSEASEGSESRDGGFHDFVRLPKISLPSFDGEKMTQWLEFRDTYLSLIHSNNNLGNINKFHYLRAALKGSALTVIKNLEFTSKNYEVAWQLLSSRYDNERLLVNIHVNSLLNFSTMTKESGKSLRNLVDTINRNLCALNTLGQPTDHWDTLVIHLMSRKLDSVTFREWEEHRNSITTSPTLKQFIDFLIGRADLLDTIQLEETQRQSTSQTNQNTQFTQNKHNTLSKNTSLNKEKITLKTTACPLCTQNHFLFSCSEFRKLSVDERLEKMKNFSVCKNCLRPGHKDSQCRLTHCKYCSLKHSTLLHKDTEQHTTVALSANIQTSNKPLTLLSTALVNVVGADGKLHPARALLDNASTGHYVTQHLCEKLGLLRRSVSSSVTGINNQLSYVAESCTLPLESYSGDFKVNLECHVLPQITNTLPSCNIDIRSLKLPPHIRLADPSFHISSPIDILVGADVFWDVICSDFIDLGKQCPKLQKTKLGWLVSGTIKAYTQSHKNKAHQSSCFFTQRDDALLTRFWELESVSSKYNLTLEEQACEKSFAENTRRDTDGRFIVTIPLKESPEVLGDNYHSAKNRLLALERRFQRDSVLKKRYYDFMTEYRDLGHMSDTVISKPTEPDSQNRYYLPHFPIIRENSTTTKCRVVFNASALNKGKTFNSIQMVGPVVQDDLLSILLRFRQHKYVVSGDIEKMYRAILVEPTQRSLQQILFRFDPSEHIRPFTLNTVTYGTASAPYLATKCLVSLAEQCSDPNTKIAISRDFYVDDFISGGDSIESVIDLCKSVDKTLLSAQFKLRKWQSNSSEVLKSLTNDNALEQINKNKTLNLDESLPCKTLGLQWDCNLDHLLFTIDLDPKAKKITKRKILSLISQIFDPLGILGPCTVQAKKVMQNLWIDKCGWDEEVSKDTQNTFLNFIDSLISLKSLRIPRWVSFDNVIRLELHTFSDASERAYGACIFVRAVDANGTVQVRLLASRNKVAPLKPTTIPRLELCGALLASRLHAKVMSSITLKVHDSFFWTDSTIVLAWLKTQSNQLKTFVRTRVGEIQDSTAGHRWSYVPSKENPADLVSRGIATNSIGSCALWWSGPDFLKTKNIQFPIIPNTQSDSTSTQRQEKTEIVLHTTTQSKDTVTHIIHELINKTSSYTHLIRSFAFVQRFIHNCKYPKNKLTQTLSTTELKNSETYILKLVQQQMFKDEYILLKSGKPLPYKNRLSSLAPFIHSDELIRVGGRLKNSHYPFDIKHPILLCGKHHLTQILFQKEHISLMHAGPQLLLSFIRQKYWPLGGRNLARRVVHRCVRCCRFKPKPIQPMMSDLPADRTRLEFPFLHTGIDYAGPIMIASRKGRGAKLEKSYICIFVCFAVKALHLELVTDLTKEAFISAFLKFISRRGKPMSVTSDNSTTFIGASNEIASFFSKYSDDIKSDLSNRDIEFRRIPQYTPHFGGLWESAVKSVKFHLKRILNLTHLTYEEMTTCLVQIEAILNSRPLTPLSSDPSDLTCLTPAHFLIGRSLLSVPRPMVSDTNIAAMDRYQRIEALKQHFWRRFSAEYVSLLQQRMKWQRGSITSLQLGSLVLVKDRAQPPLLWLLGRVEKVHPGQDGVARVAEIKTKKGVITRAFNNICPLPISNSRGQDV